ncbi:hypothetical protein CTZ28_01135 [Streptomyces shenzhenensis]|uniref:Uncharacterized protein n=1 Tax=Streptomyces shenzhenensis TaxID=943815 RepID=A0A3M0IES6_9ACTN|nr:hypothetical protein CTZ28_01135 [Streptomyces shenzhenensis]
MPPAPRCHARSRRTGHRPKYVQYEDLRPAHREHAPDAAGPALRADDGSLTTGPRENPRFRPAVGTV